MTGMETEYIRQAVEGGKISGNGEFTHRCQDFFERRYGFKKCLLTTSGTDALEMAAILTGVGPGDEVIVPTPGFTLYESLIRIAGAKMVELDLSKTGFQIDEAALNAAVTEKTKAILINSPNNPTGVVLNEQSLAAVKKVVLGKPIFIVCDNVYNQLTYGLCPDLSLDRDL